MFKTIEKLLLVLALITVLAVAGTAIADQNFNWYQGTYKASVSGNPSTSRTVTASTTQLATDVKVTLNTTSGALNYTLLPLSTTGNLSGVTIYNSGATGYNVTVIASTTDTVTNYIEGQATRLVPPGATLTITPVTGKTWKVVWETSPISVDMTTLKATINGSVQATRGFGGTVSAVTATTTFTAADCGRTVFVGTDALLMQLPKIPYAGCSFMFVNSGAAGGNILSVKANASDAFFGGISGATYQIITSATGSYIENTKTTSQLGDLIKIVSAPSTTQWIVTYGTGTWAVR